MRNEILEINERSNGASRIIQNDQPYTCEVTIEGTADMLFHRWNCESVDAKSKSAKNSKSKKTDDVESYVYRNEKGNLCLPGEYLRMAIIGAAKFKQDPRSPRKSAMDLYKAAIIPLTMLSDLGVKAWDYEHRCRVVIQKAGVNRTRPAMRVGWRAKFEFLVNLPEYISPHDLNDTIQMAGKLIGIADFRPTYGRFQVVEFK